MDKYEKLLIAYYNLLDLHKQIVEKYRYAINDLKIVVAQDKQTIENLIDVCDSLQKKLTSLKTTNRALKSGYKSPRGFLCN